MTNVPLVSSTCVYDYCVVGVCTRTSVPRVSLQCLLFLSPSKSRDLTHPLSHPTVSYERELHTFIMPAAYTAATPHTLSPLPRRRDSMHRRRDATRGRGYRISPRPHGRYMDQDTRNHGWTAHLCITAHGIPHTDHLSVSVYSLVEA